MGNTGLRLTESRIEIVAVMDGYRVTGPARQLLAAARRGRMLGILTTLAIFKRSIDPSPLIVATDRFRVPMVVIPDRFAGDPRTFFALAAHLRSLRPSILQTHGYKANVIGLFLSAQLRLPWVAFLHGETFENWKVATYFAFERLAVRRADRIVAVACHMKDRLIADGVPADKIRVVHNACLIEPAVLESVLACSPTRPPRIGIAARLSPEKGVDIGIEAFAQVVKRYPDAQLLIAGEGPEDERMMQVAKRLRVGSRVEWMGYQEDIAGFYDRLTVLLIPSRSEGLPNVALEAMAHGVPVVATAVGGIPEVVADGRTGLLAKSGDIEGLAQRIIRLLDDTLLRNRLRRNGCLEVASRFSLDTRMRALSAIYHEVLR